MGFFDEMQQKFRASGDFAQAYAHKRKASLYTKAEKNAVQVQVELQADCLAGVWAYHANKRFNILERGDIDEAINAASTIGDDTLQKRSQGYVVPDAFTHGSSAQRVEWLKKGFDSGNINICKTL